MFLLTIASSGPACSAMISSHQVCRPERYTSQPVRAFSSRYIRTVYIRITSKGPEYSPTTPFKPETVCIWFILGVIKYLTIKNLWSHCCYVWSTKVLPPSYTGMSIRPSWHETAEHKVIHIRTKLLACRWPAKLSDPPEKTIKTEKFEYHDFRNRGPNGEPQLG